MDSILHDDDTQILSQEGVGALGGSQSKHIFAPEQNLPTMSFRKNLI